MEHIRRIAIAAVAVCLLFGAALTPAFESSPSGPGTISLLDTFNRTVPLVNGTIVRTQDIRLQT